MILAPIPPHSEELKHSQEHVLTLAWLHTSHMPALGLGLRQARGNAGATAQRLVPDLQLLQWKVENALLFAVVTVK